MEKRLFVGNLSYSLSQEEMADLFAQYGTVESAKILTDRETGRSKGFGFVEMASPEEAQECIAKLNGYDLQGRKVSVSIARPQAPRDNSNSGGGRSFGNRQRY